jgi:hypothetical protein
VVGTLELEVLRQVRCQRAEDGADEGLRVCAGRAVSGEMYAYAWRRAK